MLRGACGCGGGRTVGLKRLFESDVGGGGGGCCEAVVESEVGGGGLVVVGGRGQQAKKTPQISWLSQQSKKVSQTKKPKL